MKHGFIKAAAATPAIRLADPAANAEELIRLMNEAADRGVKLLLFPELCLTGAACGDLFLQRRLQDEALAALDRLREAGKQQSMITVAGLPIRVGGRLYDCAAVLFRGEVLGIVPKRRPCADSTGGDARWFAPGPDCDLIDLPWGETLFGAGLRFRCTDLQEFSFGVEFADDLASPDSAAAQIASEANLLLVPAASCEIVGRAERRRQLLRSESGRLACGILLAEAGDGESTTDTVYAGHRLLAENGKLLCEGDLFTIGLTVSEFDVQHLTGERLRRGLYAEPDEDAYDAAEFTMDLVETELSRAVEPFPFVPADPAERAARCKFILELQAQGLASRLRHVRSSGAVIGVSGGLDSTLAMLVSARAMDILGMPRSAIQAVTMPCFGTTGRTRSNAERLSESLGASFRTVDIKAAVEQHFKDIGQDPAKTDVTFENAQARERTQVLMDISNMTGELVVGTGDISELALGWATYNGDHMSMYAVNASVPKTLMRHIVATVADTTDNAALAEVLRDILDTPVSPELLPPSGEDISQRTEDLVGPYELHDFFLYHLARLQFPPEKIFRLACRAFAGRYSPEVILGWLRTFCRRFFTQQFKRSCSPDGPKVGSLTLSPRTDFHMPSDALSAAWLRDLETL